MSESNANYTAVDGVLYSNDMTRLEAYPPGQQGEAFTVPDSVKTICLSAFSQNNLKTLTLPKDLTEIGDHAITNSWRLTAIDVPPGVKGLGAFCFESCNYLKSVTLHEGLETIGEYAFFGCSGVYELELPEGLTTIGNHAFSSMRALQKLYIPDSVTEIGTNIFEGIGGVTLYTTNQTAAAYAQQNGVACETATVEEYRAVETEQPQTPDPTDPTTPTSPTSPTDPTSPTSPTDPTKPSSTVMTSPRSYVNRKS